MKTAYPIQGYSFLEKLGQSSHAEVFKVCRQGESDRPLVLKIINPNIGSGDLHSGLRQQIEYLKQVDMPGVINPELHNTEGGTSFLVQEFFDGRNLNTWRRSRQDIPISDLLKVLSSITGILAGIHKAGHIHGGIKPNNILIAEDTLGIRLIDLVRVIDVGEISHFIYDEDFRKNTLSYISPEQTGRIRQRVDYTTDLYSLGVVFYELIGGAPPFTSNDPLEVIHSHLAEDPIPLNKKSPEAPEMLSDIVARPALYP